MTNIPKTTTGPLFKSVDELHAALVNYAQQALEHTTHAYPLHIENEADAASFVRFFDSNARERMAQIAQALWMEREAAEDPRGTIEVDGIPLSSVEEAIYGTKFASSLAFGEAEEYVRHHRMVRRIADEVARRAAGGGR